VPGQVGPVLDLGCGTGLVAVALSDLPLGPWVGVDLAPRMLERAATKRLYAGLHEADIIDFLAGNTQHWGLILAADVLCYLGALEPLFAAAYPRLQPGALFICSAEELVGPYFGNGDWVLGRQGRYAHAGDYIARAAHAAGFAVRAFDAEVQRQDAGAPVPGFMIVLERPHAVG
jgi:predicted TPR repeat methyltransferase